MTVDEAYDRICRAIDAGRPANGYLVVGGVRGMGGELSDRVLRHLFGDVDLVGCCAYMENLALRFRFEHALVQTSAVARAIALLYVV